MTAAAIQDSRYLVLVVDDVPDARESCADFLSARGFSVVTAADGREAVALASELHPDVVLMDLRMPVMDGLEATRRLKEDRQTSQIPVIAITAHAVESAPKEALEAGCSEVLIKPCMPDELEKAVRRSLPDGAEQPTA